MKQQSGQGETAHDRRQRRKLKRMIAGLKILYTNKSDGPYELRRDLEANENHRERLRDSLKIRGLTRLTTPQRVELTRALIQDAELRVKARQEVQKMLGWW